MAISDIQNSISANRQPITERLHRSFLKIVKVEYQQNSDVVDDVIDYPISSVYLIRTISIRTEHLLTVQN